ncbi:ABC transporter substrate-binding protein [Nonomuraea diastatica]|uniref:ABC transporter substrate-binding protein n=1 Tax=Nonomuraea diastatica TaxID=1848329 RepID=A0A4R4WW84_9ACTN|nr:ABC transporter substrate-binding protein [Nonomuraea diastatica]TDD21994.1 ABC transporter substrate-binding protein [Nonomuraea diastatica]
MVQSTPPEISRRAFLHVGAAAGAGLLTGCAGPTGSPAPGSMVLALNRSLVSLDNKLNQFEAAVTVQRGVRQALTRIGPDLTPQPVLAERFELTSPTEWSVRLREGARYSDGSPVTPKDVATALEMYQKVNGSFIASFFPEWPEVVEDDARTFRLRSREPLPVLDYLMANILITPSAANQPQELQAGVGSGPYQVTQSNRGTGVYTLQADPRYWGPKPGVRTVHVRFIQEESSRVVALRSGEIDVIDTISPDSAEQLRGLPDVELTSAVGTRINQLFFNFRKPAGHPLADARVRRALTFAVDGRTLAEDVLQGTVIPAEGVVSEVLAGAVKTGRYVHDPAMAAKLLAEAGVRPGDLNLRIIWETGEFPSDTLLMEGVQQMLERVGVRCTLRQFEPGGGIAKWRQGRAGDWDLLGNGFSVPTGLAYSALQGMYGGTAEKEKTRDTYHGYVQPEVVRLLDRASQEIDAEARMAVVAEVQRAVWETWPCLWAFVPRSILAHRRRVRGLALEPTNSYDLAALRLDG